MTSIVLKNFSGELPNLPKYLLPDQNAQQAIYCDFAQKDLRPLKQGELIKTMSNTVKGIYSEDGLKFFTWPIETNACKSPVIEDTYGRVYFMNANGFRVTTASLAALNGGEPSSSWLVGVPAPTVAPTLTLVERTTLRGYTTTSIVVKAWYELNGRRYNEATVTATEVSAYKTYTFTPPTKTPYDESAQTGTPDAARLCASFTLTDTAVTPNRQIFSVNVTSGASPGTSTQALPGGVTLTLSDAGQIDFSWGIYETRAYTYTAVNTWNEESAPSPASLIDVTYMQDVRLVVTAPVFTNYRPFSAYKFYRTFGASATYCNIAVTTESATQFLDLTYSAASVGAALKSADWALPVTGMFGLTALPNGVFAAFKDNVLYFSEPYRPHTWQYSMTFPLNVRGICSSAQSLVVTTANGAYLVMGKSPAGMGQQLLTTPQAGISHRSMTMIEGAVVYSSNDGLVLVSGSSASLNVSQQFFSREDWRSRYGNALSTMRLAYHDGFVVASDSASATGFFVRMDEAAGTLSQYNVQTDAMFYLPLLDTLYYSVGANVYRFRTSSSYYTLDWWSKEFVLPKYVNFAAAYIRCTGSVVVTLYAAGVQAYQFTASATGYYRLPAGNRALQWSVRFQTAASVQEFAIAESMGELRSV